MEINDTDKKEMHSLEDMAREFSERDDFIKLMTFYRCAIMQVVTKLNVLNEEFSLQYDRNPFEQIEHRLKKPVSIVEKMQRRNVPLDEAKEVSISDDTETDLLEGLMKLPKHYRISMFLHYYEGYKVYEIASMLGKQPNTISAYLTRGKRKLKSMMSA